MQILFDAVTLKASRRPEAPVHTGCIWQWEEGIRPSVCQASLAGSNQGFCFAVQLLLPGLEDQLAPALQLLARQALGHLTELHLHAAHHLNAAPSCGLSEDQAESRMLLKRPEPGSAEMQDEKQ